MNRKINKAILFLFLSMCQNQIMMQNSESNRIVTQKTRYMSVIHSPHSGM